MWTLNHIGTKRGILKKLQDIEDVEQSQLKAMKAYVTSVFDSLPETVTHVHLKASGDYSPTRFSLTIKVTPVEMAVDEVSK